MTLLALVACSADPELRLHQVLDLDVQAQPTEQEGMRWLLTTVEQPLDPDDPSAGSFEQRVSILHRDWDAPVVLHTHGYADSWEDALTEPAWLLSANQISVEHRFFGESVPDDPDWSQLRLEAVAADLHAVVSLLQQVYPGPWVSTGASKGGMTALVHRAAWPEDVVGTVAYVAPFMHSARDAAFLDASRWQPHPECQAALRAAQLAALDQADAIGAIFSQEHSYQRMGVRAAMETIIVEADWTFWQYDSFESCEQVPGAEATVEELAAWLAGLAGDSGSDGFIAAYAPYFWQALAELGYPDLDLSPFASRLQADYWDWSAILPAPAPAFDGAVIDHTRAWVEEEADHVMLVYGEYDPWTNGAVDPAPTGDNARYDVRQVGHRAQLGLLPAEQWREAAQRLERWVR